MKRMNKIKLLAASTIMPTIVASIAAIASCGNETKDTAPVFTYAESKEINLRNRTKFQLIFESDKVLTDKDVVEATAEDLQVPGHETIVFVYNKKQSLEQCEGKKAVFDATVENARDGSYIEFNVKLNYSREGGSLPSEQLFDGFTVDCQMIDGNITIAEGQQHLLTQPKTPIQYYKFNLNDTRLSPDDRISATAVTIKKSDNVDGVEFSLEPYIEGNNLYICFEIKRKSGAQLTENDGASFKFSVTCTNGNQILWVNKFGDETNPFILDYCDAPGIVPESQQVSKPADHDAGVTKQEMRFYVADIYKTITPTLKTERFKSEFIVEAKLEATQAQHDEKTNFYYWPISVNVARSGSSLVDGDVISYDLIVDLGSQPGEVTIKNCEFDYVSSKMENMSDEAKTQRTFMGSTIGRFYCTLLEEIAGTDHLDLEVISTSKNAITPVRAHTTADRRGKEVWFEVKLTCPALIIDSKEYGTFNVRLTCSDINGNKRWREDFDGLTLQQFNDPLSFANQEKEQYVDFDPTKTEFSYTWNFKVDKKGVSKADVSKITWRPIITSSSPTDISITLEQGEYDELTGTLPITAYIVEGSRQPISADYVKFSMQASVSEGDSDWPWTYTEDGFMIYLWGGYWLSRNTTIKYSVKEYPQHALSCEYVDDIPEGTSPGMSAIVNVDTSAWNEEWPGDDWKWIFALPKDPDKGFGEGYWPVNKDKVVVTVNDGINTRILERTDTYADLQTKPNVYFVSDSGPITTSKLTIKQGYKITYQVELGGDQDVTKKTRFYFTYHN